MTEMGRKAWDRDKLKVMEETIPMRRLAEPADVACACVWLLSDLASLVTGASLPVDGGRSMGGHGL
jgi:NAD(P)-dependent dehydrogenase (short-subunit alcohol dehydrogenase family)